MNQPGRSHTRGRKLTQDAQLRVCREPTGIHKLPMPASSAIANASAAPGGPRDSSTQTGIRRCTDAADNKNLAAKKRVRRNHILVLMAGEYHMNQSITKTRTCEGGGIQRSRFTTSHLEEFPAAADVHGWQGATQVKISAGEEAPSGKARKGDA